MLEKITDFLFTGTSSDIISIAIAMLAMIFVTAYYACKAQGISFGDAIKRLFKIGYKK